MELILRLNLKTNITSQAGERTQDYSDYRFQIDTQADAWGETTEAQQDSLNDALEAEAERRFPGIRVTRGLETKVTGPNEFIAEDIHEAMGEYGCRLLESITEEAGESE